MRLRNKLTGEIGWLYCDHISNPKKITVFAKDKDLSAKHWDYNSLAELNEEWEDYKEPKEFYNLMYDGEVNHTDKEGTREVESMKAIGNYFETKEEAERAVEKLKAWKRLKDKGLKITGYGEYAYDTKSTHHINIALDYVRDEDRKDLDLLFSREDG